MKKIKTNPFLYTLTALCAFAACTSPVSDMPPVSSSSFGSFFPPSAPYDPDLRSWKTVSWTPFTANDSIAGFAWGWAGAGEIYVAVSSTGIIGYSQDGNIWEAAGPAPKTRPADPEPYNPFDPDPSKRIGFNAVAFGGGAFIAVGNGGKMAYSRDGIRWSVKPVGFGGLNIYGIAYGMPRDGTGNVFVAVGENAGIVYSKDDGLNWWNGGTIAGFSGGMITDICFGDGAFYVVGEKGNTGKSSNPAGGIWIHYLYGSGTPINTGTINKIAYGRYGDEPGVAVLYNDGFGTSRNIAVITAAAFGIDKSWDADLDSGYFAGNTIRVIAYGGGNFVAAGTGSMIGFWPSIDKSNNNNRYWRALPFYEFQYWEITALAALNGRFYAGNIGGKIGYSK
jgi:hypothetical protein